MLTKKRATDTMVRTRDVEVVVDLTENANSRLSSKKRGTPKRKVNNQKRVPIESVAPVRFESASPPVADQMIVIQAIVTASQSLSRMVSALESLNDKASVIRDIIDTSNFVNAAQAPPAPPLKKQRLSSRPSWKKSAGVIDINIAETSSYLTSTTELISKLSIIEAGSVAITTNASASFEEKHSAQAEENVCMDNVILGNQDLTMQASQTPVSPEDVDPLDTESGSLDMSQEIGVQKIVSLSTPDEEEEDGEEESVQLSSGDETRCKVQSQEEE